MSYRLIKVLLLGMLCISTIQEAISNPDELFVNDIICPTILPAYVASTTSCDAFITIGPPTSTTCTILSFFNDFNFTNDASDTYPVGTTTVVFTVQFTTGVVVTCSIDIVVIDQTTPILTCPIPPQLTCDISELPIFQSFTEFEMAGGSASDNCGLDVSSFTHVPPDQVTSMPGDCPITMRRMYMIKDVFNQEGTGFQNITILDDVDPVIVSCPSDLTINIPNCGPALNVQIPEIMVTDNCTANPPTITNDHNGGGANASGEYPLGITTVTFTVTDNCGNVPTTTCSVDVTVLETTPPVADCPTTTISFPLDAMGVAVIDPLILIGNSSDNCGIENIIFTPPSLDCSHVNNPINIGVIIEDASGNAVQCTVSVEAEDNTPPMITCPANFTGDCSDPLAIPITDPNAIATDNCALATISHTDVTTVICPNYNITRTYTVTDTEGNPAVCTQTLVLTSTIAPTFTVPADVTLECDQDPLNLVLTGSPSNISTGCGNGTTETFSDTAPTSTDPNCPFAVSFVRTWTVTDVCTNLFSTDTQVINIDDTTGPIFGVAPVAGDVECFDVSPTMAPAWPVTDNCSAVANITTDVTIQSGAPNVCADVIVSYLYTATDECGNTSTNTLSFTLLKDEVAPVVTVAWTSMTIDCDDPMPAFPDVVTVVEECSTLVPPGPANITTTYFGPLGQVITQADIPTYICTGYSYTYTWTPEDECGNAAATPIVATITVNPDTTPPAVDPPSAVIMVPTDPGTCSASLSSVPEPTGIVDCSAVTISLVSIEYMGGLLDLAVVMTDGLQPDKLNNYTFTWEIMDACTNTAPLHIQQVMIADKEPPACAGAQSFNVSLTTDCTDVPIASFGIMGMDNCSDPSMLTYLVKRMDDPGLPSPIGVTVCCDDIEINGTGIDTVLVQIFIVDECGNGALTPACMDTVFISDKVPPVLSNPLADVTVDCDLDISDLSIFGTYVPNGDPRSTYTFNYPPIPPASFMDGTVEDNCNIDTVYYVLTDLRDPMCGTGDIIRTFFADDGHGNVSIGVPQTITILNTNVFTLADITPPANVTYTDTCIRVAPIPEITGFPILADKSCSMVGYSYTDTDLNEPYSGCVTFIRTWKVIDWCQYESNNPHTPGIWEFDQDIIVTNTVAPVVTCDGDLEACTNEETCIATLNITGSATDLCTDVDDLLWRYTLDEGDDGTVEITGYSQTITNMVARGIYRITWYVDDRCGNEGSCSQLLTVRDCKDPSPVCIHGIAINLNEMSRVDPDDINAFLYDTMAVIWAKDYNASSFDNCTDQDDLVYSFSTDTSQTSLAFDCGDANDTIPIELWVTDIDGNQAFCNTFLIVQDNHGLCPVQRPMISITGNVTNYNDDKMENVSLRLVESNSMTEDMTDEDGDYAFNDLEMYKDYKITPNYEDEYLNGVSTLDLVLIQRHILGLQNLDSAYKILAADVNTSLTVDAIDLIEIRKLILGVRKEFPNAPSWKFVDGQFEFVDQNYPWLYASEMQMFDLDYDANDMNFIGVKTGDVNGSASFNLLGSNVEKRAQDFTMKIRVRNGMTELVAAESINMYGLQFTIAGRLHDADLSSDLINLEELHYNLEDGNISFSWNDSYLTKVNPGDVILSINNGENVDINSTLVKAEIYDESLAVKDIVSTRNYDEKSDFLVAQNHPNPFKEQTNFEIFVPTEGGVTMQLFDTSGKKLLEKNLTLMAGENAISINGHELNGYTGIVYCSFIYGGQTTTKSIIKM